MEPLHKTKTAYSFDEYFKFNKTLLFRQKNYKAITVVLPILYILTALCVFYLVRETAYLILWAALFPVFIIVFIASFKRSVKKTYYSNKSITSCVAEFEFYDGYVAEKTENGESRIDYSKIYNIIETKTNFYIMLAINQGFIIVKENCTPELIEFIQSLKTK